MNFLDSRLPVRFWDKVQPCPMSGCWLWTAFQNPKGYGMFKTDGVTLLAHRFAYEQLRESVPNGLVLDHRVCQQRCCVNPAHLEAVTIETNTLRGRGALHQAEKTHCPRGHEYAGDNLYYATSGNGWRGARRCRRCRNESNRRSKAKAAARQGVV